MQDYVEIAERIELQEEKLSRTDMRLLIIILFALLFAGCADNNSTMKGIQAFDAEDYAIAHEELAPLAAKGNSEAQFYIGKMNYFGLGVPKDLDIAFVRYTDSAEQGYAKNVKSVFKKYLVKGKPGYVSHQWASLSDAVGWICGSGGKAVIAHPARYKLGKNLLDELLLEFRALGGSGLEVITASHTPEQSLIFARHANRMNLLASCGSDFHGPEESYFDLGRMPDFPIECMPVWHDWDLRI